MKRSDINKAILMARDAFTRGGFILPGFAYWTFDEWKLRLPGLSNIQEIGLGWDVTDFGSGDFAHCGSVLFTLRNGRKGHPEAGTPYAEKLIFQLHKTQQEIPLHFHTEKTEDIINRSGGLLMLSVYQSLADGKLDSDSSVHVRMDGIDRTLKAGIPITIPPGNSITLTPGLYHRFWAQKGAGNLIAGEVSSVNDDSTDNTFFQPAARFIPIEENVPPLCPLCNEYARYCDGNEGR